MHTFCSSIAVLLIATAITASAQEATTTDTKSRGRSRIAVQRIDFDVR